MMKLEELLLYNTYPVDKHLAYLTVFSNTFGETLNFKFYDSTQNQVVEANQSVGFEIDGNKGSVSQPYVLSELVLSNEANLLTFGFDGIVPESLNKEALDWYFVLPEGTDPSALTPVFTLSEGARMQHNNQQLTSATRQLILAPPNLFCCFRR